MTEMHPIWLTWPKHPSLPGYRVAPAGVPWCTEGSAVRIGDRWTFIADIGHADGYRKTLCSLDGVATIGAGCRQFTLADALRHWETHADDRSMTLCMMQSAIAIAGLHGLRFE
jgi:hypothetical protein